MSTIFKIELVVNDFMTMPAKEPSAVVGWAIKMAIIVGFGFLFGFMMYASGW